MVYPRRLDVVPCAIYTVGSSCLSILNELVCICQPQIPNPSLPHPYFTLAVSLFSYVSVS